MESGALPRLGIKCEYTNSPYKDADLVGSVPINKCFGCYVLEFVHTPLETKHGPLLRERILLVLHYKRKGEDIYVEVYDGFVTSTRSINHHVFPLESNVRLHRRSKDNWFNE